MGLFAWTLAAVLAPIAAAAAADPPAPAPTPGAEPAGAIEEASETFPSHGKRVAVERLAPKGPGRYPLVVVLHGAGGIGPGGTGSPLHQEARLLARRGYVALVPHYFDRTAGAKLNNPTRNARYYKVWMETIADAVTYAGRLPNVDRRHIGLLGHSLGAGLAVSNAMADPRIAAVVEYAGSLVFINGPPQEPLPMPPTLILHGDADTIVPVSEAHKLNALFTEWQTTFEIKIYPGAGHGFRGDDEKDAWKRTVEFLDRHLKGTR
jgi:carboxymethylenebutenolidase